MNTATHPTPITLEQAMSWEPCYTDKRMAKLFSSPKTPLEILALNEGAWSKVPQQDRMWAITQEGVLPDQLLRLFACWCAERSLKYFETEHPDDTRPRDAIEVARRYAAGKATGEELAAARDAAWASAGDAAWASAWASAWAAAGDAAGDAAWAAAGDADWASAWDDQFAKLIEMVTVWTETGDVFGGEGVNS